MARAKWKLIGVSQYYEALSTKNPQSKEQQLVALDRLSFTQAYGEIIGLVGGKGAGKSTLGKILTEECQPSEGLVSGGADQVGKLRLPNRRNEEKTAENYTRQQLIKWGISKKKLSQLTERICGFSELGEHFQQRIRSFTTEEKIQLEISILLHVAPMVIYIDESLLVVKEDFYIKVFLFLLDLKELGSSIWIETDSIKRIEPYCDKLVWLEFGKLKKHGDVLDVLVHYDDYYFQIQRLSLRQQQEFWREGYAGQLLRNELGRAEVIEEQMADERVDEYDESHEVEDLLDLEEPREARTSTLTRSQTHRRPAKKNAYWLVGVLVIALLVTGAYFTLDYLYPKENGRLTLPKTGTNSSLRTGNSTSKQGSTPNSNWPTSSQEASNAEGTHLVKSGETISQIADLYNVTITQLREWNQLTSDDIYPGLGLKLSQPTKESLENEKEKAVASFKHRVEEGDSLTSIAEKYGVSLVELQEVNQLTTVTIYTGTELILPGKAKATTTSESKKETTQAQTPTQAETEIKKTESQHVVSQGENLYSIARKYGVDVMAIQGANHLQTEELYPGQALVIP